MTNKGSSLLGGHGSSGNSVESCLPSTHAHTFGGVVGPELFECQTSSNSCRKQRPHHAEAALLVLLHCRWWCLLYRHGNGAV